MIMCSTMSCSRLPPFYRPEHMMPHTSFCPSTISISLLKKSSLHSSQVCLYEKEEQDFRVFGLAWRCSFLVMQYGLICTPALQPQLPPWFHEQRLIEMIQLIAVLLRGAVTGNRKHKNLWLSRSHGGYQGPIWIYPCTKCTSTCTELHCSCNSPRSTSSNRAVNCHSYGFLKACTIEL